MMITAHSGCDGTPDNSLAFVRHALAIAPDAFEVDVHRRSDGVLVIGHDTDETARYVDCPTLSEVFALLREKPPVGINCDLKDAGLEQAVIALHAAEAPQNPLLLSGTVSDKLLREKPALFAQATVLLNAELGEEGDAFYHRLAENPQQVAEAAEAAARACKDCGAKVVNVNYNACTEAFLRIMDGHGLGASVWTPNDVETARFFAARGVFNITTRNAIGLLEAFR